MKLNAKTAIKQVGHIIDLWMPLKLEYDRAAGVSIAIAHKGKILYAKGFGYADMKRREKADAKTLYHIASHSKMFTATAVLKLAEQGKLRLNDKVSSYIPWFKGKNKDKDASKITIRQLLSHKAGIFRDGDTPHWNDGKFPKDLKRPFSLKALIIKNSTKFKYTNYGYSLLGLVIEKASDMSYGDYVTENILKPLSLKNTHPDYMDGLKHIATGYGADLPGAGIRAFGHYKTNAYAPATGFVSNSIDITKFMSMFLHERKSVLSKQSLDEMTKPHAKTGDGDEYGLGLDIFHIGKHKVIGHGGGFNGFYTRTVLNLHNGVSVEVFANSQSLNPTQLAVCILKIVGALMDGDGKYAAGRKISYGNYEGVYRNNWGDSLVVRAGNILVGLDPSANNPFKQPRRLMPTGKPHAFIMKSDNLYGPYDEETVFSDFKNGKARKSTTAGMPMRRIEG
ncbi:MAG: beta-lactamase family protein [Patescibacteria group bacterium]|nr:beta-lactamase family protein [Patescibacteria group bacterium]